MAGVTTNILIRISSGEKKMSIGILIIAAIMSIAYCNSIDRSMQKTS